MDIKGKARTGIKWTTFSSVFIFAISILQLSVLSRFLDKEELGMLSVLMIAQGFADIIRDLGISNSIIHFQDTTKRQMNTLYWINVAMALLIALSFVSLPFLVSNFFDSEGLSAALRPLGIVVLLSAFGHQFQYLYYKELRFSLIAKIEILQSLTIFLSTLFFLFYLEYGILSIVYGMVAGALVYSLAYCYKGFANFYFPNWTDFSIAESKAYLSFGAYQLGERFVNYFSSHLDKMLIGRFYGMSILGAYELAYRLALRPFSLINPIFNKVSLPVFSSIQNDHQLLNQWYLKKIRTITFLSFPAYIGLLVLSEEIIHLLYGAGWDLTVDTFNIIGILGLFWSLSNPIGSYLLALGKPQYGFWMNVYRLVIYAGIFTFSGWYLDYKATLWCYLIIGTAAVFPVEYLLRYHLTQMRVFEHVKAFAGNLLIASAMGGLVWVGKYYLYQILSFPLLVLSLSILLGILVYLLLHWLFNRNFLFYLYQQFKRF